MKKLLLLKVILKNIARLHPRYLYLVRKNKIQTKPSITNQIKKKNIFIITSCVNVHDNIDYPIHNRDHTSEERLIETLIGLKSVRDKYADSYIIFLESSKISNQDKRQIADLIDEYYDYSECKSIKIARKHFNKGVPQFTALINFFEENRDNYHAETFHFLGARYSLTANITGNTSPTAGAHFFHYPEHNNVSTRYFFISKLTMSEMLEPFRKTRYCAMAGASVEDFINCFFKKNAPLKKLGIEGKVNGKEMIYE